MRLALATVVALALSGQFIFRLPAPAEDAENPFSAARMPAGDTTLPNPTWAAAGVTGGIPTRTRCTTGGGSSILPAGTSAATINTAIQNCDANHYVELGAGTFTIGGITFAGKNNVSLRGQGADSTFLEMSGTTSCGGLSAGICAGENDGYYADTGGSNPSVIVDWTGNYTQGSTTITVSATTGLAVDEYIVLDQQNDSSDGGGIYVCNTDNVCSDEGGGTNERSGRSQREWHKVTAINGLTLTIDPPIIAPNWASGKNPDAWWGSSNLGTGVGVENLSIDMNTTQTRCILLFYMSDSWVSGVRCINPEGDNNFVEFGAILAYGGAHITFRDSYIWGNQGLWASGTYGFTTYGAGLNLIENNMQANRCCAFFINGDLGSVIAYNHALDSRYDAGGGTTMQFSNYMHEGGSMLNLNEGNDTIGAANDTVHATSNLFVHLRNRYLGKEAGKTSQTNAVFMTAYNRYMSFACNVVGDNSYHTVYTSTTGSNAAVFALGGSYGSIGADSITNTSSMRWGNYDTVNDATRWESSEVPSGISILPNPVPSTQTCPSSMYLSAAPSYFTNASVAWPSIGPDVTCGSNCPTGVGNHVVKNPARVCYESLSNDAGYADPGSGHERAKTFNATACYGR